MSLIDTTISIVTTRKSWFYPYSLQLADHLKTSKLKAQVLDRHEDITAGQDIVFYLSYFRIVPEEVLSRSTHNIVVHESGLPKGRGWAPMFWQVIEGKNQIPAVAFEATKDMDAGPIYARTTVELNGTELHGQIRQKQARSTEILVLECVHKFERGQLIAEPQRGEPSYYPKRTPADSRLDPHKTIAEQFDLLRTVNNQEFPAFFDFRGQRYLITIDQDNREDV